MNIIFSTISTAAKYARVNNDSIIYVCIGEYEYAGILSDGR